MKLGVILNDLDCDPNPPPPDVIEEEEVINITETNEVERSDTELPSWVVPVIVGVTLVLLGAVIWIIGNRVCGWSCTPKHKVKIGQQRPPLDKNDTNQEDDS